MLFLWDFVFILWNIVYVTNNCMCLYENIYILRYTCVYNTYIFWGILAQEHDFLQGFFVSIGVSVHLSLV